MALSARDQGGLQEVPHEAMERWVIRAIFFDYDGVLTTDKSGSQTTYRYLSEATGISPSTIRAAFNPFDGDLLTGKQRYADIWRKACKSMGEEIDIALLTQAFESTPRNKPMFSLAQRLGANYAVGIITDNNKDRMDHLRKHQRLDALFHPIVVSADIGSSKRDQDIFLHATSSAGAVPEESIFIDNSEANLVMARALGMHAIFHDDEKNDIGALTAQLERLGACVDEG